MALTRRAVVRTGAASVLVLGAAGSWLSTRTSTSAREPWRQAGESFGDPRLDALAFAILAPNPHNMQPWQVRLTGEDGFLLTANLSRRRYRTASTRWLWPKRPTALWQMGSLSRCLRSSRTTLLSATLRSMHRAAACASLRLLFCKWNCSAT